MSARIFTTLRVPYGGEILDSLVSTCKDQLIQPTQIQSAVQCSAVQCSAVQCRLLSVDHLLTYFARPEEATPGPEAATLIAGYKPV